MVNQKKIDSKIKKDKLVKFLIHLIASFSIVMLVLMFGFILYNSWPAIKGKKFIKIFFSSDIKNFGILSALFVTLVTSFGAILIALPISKRLAILIRYRTVKFSKFFRIIIDILAGVPSVIYGIFAINSLGKLSSFITHTTSKLTIFNATLMLSIMIIPTMVSLITNQLYLVKPTLLESSIALGNTKTKAIYSIALKSIKPGIFVAMIVSLGRAIGETMATSMVLSTSVPKDVLKEGLGFFNQSYNTLASAIAGFMFTDSNDPIIVHNAFAMGLSLFIIIMLLVLVMTYISSKKKFSKPAPFKTKKCFLIVKDIFILPIYVIYYLLFYINYVFKKMFSAVKTICISCFLAKGKRQERFKRNLFLKKINTLWMIFWEIICAISLISIILWIMFDIFIIGSQGFYLYDFNPKKPGLMNALLWTILLVVVTIVIAFPLALFTAIYLSEYAKNSFFGKVVKFFLDSLGGTPSILFGIFGMILFLDLIGLRATGKTSLLAGALTMVLVILPAYTRSIEQIISNIPNELREASLALGASKWETLRKIILPKTIAGIVSGTIISISRIISETAPIFLTLGMSFNPNFGLLNQGQTLTTWILNNQIYGTEPIKFRIIQSYKYALITIVIISILILISYSIEPIFRFIKRRKSIKKYKRIKYD
ncbi:phosphate ABC transporter permease PstA [Mycoplasma sp. Mirounga ES2805-ORL]|uniref:phosphate ABC transporter permease PstA n=1 Tax=Mycoplasma sp. Mirounga ES2805-ORL TaxID=754514 RepID=UPI00197B08A3|nr:phosphate ABC transporter permease PstA [Mycoplasma sp. Mirounga ES2805-ORL]